MTQEEENDIYNAALKKFGWDNQVDMLIEEMAELTQALLKYRRNPDEANNNHLCEEFVDVHIVFKQVITEMPFQTLAGWKKIKLNRLQKLINQ